MLHVNLQKRLPDFDLDIEFTFDNGILVLFGPSGAGKTTILQCIAGLQQPENGLVKLDDKMFYSTYDRVNMAPRYRNIGYVFQDYALFPHLSVKDNVLYGIPKRCKSKSTYKMSVLEVLDKLKITHLQNRWPHQLSGGEKQRVALARALMVEPDLLLLDEPLSALDEATRSSLQKELQVIQKEWQIPFILVTHNKAEAQKLGHETVYLMQGRKYQVLPGKGASQDGPNKNSGHHPAGW